MKNKNLLTLLFSIVALSGCSLVPELKPTELPVEDIKPGEIPSGGEEVTMDDAVNALKDLYNNFKAHDGLSIKLKDSNFKVTTDYKRWGYYYYDEEGRHHESDKLVESGNVETYDFKNANAEVNITGLKNATSFKDYRASGKGSVNISYSDTNDVEKEYAFENQNAEVEMYYTGDKFYSSYSDFIINNMMYEKAYPNKAYTSFDATILDEEFKEATDLVLPLLSDANISFVKSLVSSFDFEKNIGADKEKVESLIEAATSKLFTVNKYGNDYLLSLNLTKDNLVSKVSEVLDKLYEEGLFNIIEGETVSPADYNEEKQGMMEEVSKFNQNFNYAKLSFSFDNNFFKSIAAEVDFSTVEVRYDHKYDENGNPTEEWKSREVKTSYTGNAAVTFEYSDDVKVTFPSFNEYVDINTIYEPENIVAAVNEYAQKGDYFDRWDVARRCQSSLSDQERNYEEEYYYETYYLGYNEYDGAIRFLNDYKAGKSFKAIKIKCKNNNDDVISAEIIENAKPTIYVLAQAVDRDIYQNGNKWTYEGLVELFGEPTSETTVEPTGSRYVNWRSENYSIECYIENNEVINFNIYRYF